ncbi:4'-phosphopantetheinyl transferase family protein [Chitinophaga sp. Hz27]|uniref:4'-phosphopantetheinyl transferase family protein n=1 Tax=Chitinophaga sp. Hz27 TaxID=3347169 RepID=UPI0035E1E3FE
MITFSCFLYRRQLSSTLFDVLLHCLPVNMRIEVCRYNRWEDRQNRLFGRLLLRDLLCEEGYSPDSLERVNADAAGKLFLEDASVDFNLSHSGNMVLAAITRSGRIGVDVELKAALKPKDIAVVLRPEELERLQREDKDALYGLWTRKESLVKARGQGLAIDVRDIYLRNDNRATLQMNGLAETWFYQQLPLPADYVAVLCTSQLLPEAVFLPAEDLIDRAIRYAGIDIATLPLFV